jgi:uncharacterized protein (TIGR02001 family)
MHVHRCFTCAIHAIARVRHLWSLPLALKIASFTLIAVILSWTLAGAAEAQLTADIGVQNSYRLRGYSVVDGHPTVALGLYYDHLSGLYAGVSGLAELEGDATPKFLGYIANIGYARLIGPEVTLDGGLVRTQFSRYAIGQSADAHYTDLYAGLSRRGVSARFHYSPDYYHSGASTLYGEVNGALKPGDKWRLTGHIGLLKYVTHPLTPSYYYDSKTVRYDWLAGIVRQFGRLSLHADLSGGGPQPPQQLRYAGHQGTALVVGANWVF